MTPPTYKPCLETRRIRHDCIPCPNVECRASEGACDTCGAAGYVIEVVGA